MALRYPELKTAYDQYCRDREALWDDDSTDDLALLAKGDQLWAVLLESVYQATKEVNRRDTIMRLTRQGNTLEWIERLTTLTK